MAEEKKFDWIGAGPSGMALTDALMDRLVERGVLTQSDKHDIVMAAIAALERSGNAEMQGSADNLRIIFKKS